jgi:hypothetical protein
MVIFNLDRPFASTSLGFGAMWLALAKMCFHVANRQQTQLY